MSKFNLAVAVVIFAEWLALSAFLGAELIKLTPWMLGSVDMAYRLYPISFAMFGPGLFLTGWWIIGWIFQASLNPRTVI